METFTRKERAEYNARRAAVCERLDITQNMYNWLRRKGEQLHRLDEENCNGGVSEEEFHQKETDLMLRIHAYLFGIGGDLAAYHQSDPRGCALYIDTLDMTPSNYTNGVAIY